MISDSKRTEGPREGKTGLRLIWVFLPTTSIRCSAALVLSASYYVQLPPSPSRPAPPRVFLGLYSCLPRRATASIAFPTTTKKASSTRGIFNAASCRRYCSPTLAASSVLSLCLRGLSLRRRAGSALTPFSKYRSLRRTLSRRFSNFHDLSFSESLSWLDDCDEILI